MSFKLEHEILNQSIEDFDVTENFRLDFLRAGFNTLADALAFDADYLVKEKRFTIRTITELITLLDSQGLGNYLLLSTHPSYYASLIWLGFPEHG